MRELCCWLFVLFLLLNRSSTYVVTGNTEGVLEIDDTVRDEELHEYVHDFQSSEIDNWDFDNDQRPASASDESQYELAKRIPPQTMTYRRKPQFGKLCRGRWKNFSDTAKGTESWCTDGRNFVQYCQMRKRYWSRIIGPLTFACRPHEFCATLDENGDPVHPELYPGKKEVTCFTGVKRDVKAPKKFGTDPGAMYSSELFVTEFLKGPGTANMFSLVNLVGVSFPPEKPGQYSRQTGNYHYEMRVGEEGTDPDNFTLAGSKYIFAGFNTADPDKFEISYNVPQHSKLSFQSRVYFQNLTVPIQVQTNWAFGLASAV